jgi:ATP-dependent metalloprotease
MSMKKANVAVPSYHTLSPLTQAAIQRPLTSYSFGPFRLGTAGLSLQPGLQRRFLFRSASSGSYSHLSHMEQTANNNPQSATAQNAFYSALLRANHPEMVVQRYQSGHFASNPACEALYLRALERVSSAENASAANAANAEALQPDLQARPASQTQQIAMAAAGAKPNGVRGNPLHVVVEESTGSLVFRWAKFVVWLFVGVYLFYAVAALVLEASGMFRRVNGSRPFEAKPELQKARFADVHGCDEAKEELQEIVDFLKSPQKYSTLGGKMPKGVLLEGPPGTGKTLLARAVAGEAGVPFFYMSGSEFDEVYVGVGAKRVRELFNAARAKAPAIVFIDELDAIGGKRNERDAAYAKQTLNQLLTDLDGFNQSSGVIFLAATNFPQLLDKALTRPGRFDRRVVVPLPDVRGRLAILKHYMEKMAVGPNVDASIIARGTPGLSGADLENLTNQAAVRASKRQATTVDRADFEWAKDRILMGAERRSFLMPQKEKIMTAYHEGGHAIVALFTPHADPLYKATIMPRGHALGITYQLPEMDKLSMSQREFLAKIDVCMGGKVAEEMVYGVEGTSGGASSDISHATRIAYNMVTRYGMSPKLGNVDLARQYNHLPTATQQAIWEEVHRIIGEGKERAERLLTARRKELDLLAKALVEYETLNKDEIEKVIRGEKLPGAIKALAEAPMKLPELPPVDPMEGAPAPAARVGEGEGGQQRAQAAQGRGQQAEPAAQPPTPTVAGAS